MGVPWISLPGLEQMLVPEQNPEQRPSDLLHQGHPLSLGIPNAAGDEVKVYAVGYAGARDVGSIPYRFLS